MDSKRQGSAAIAKSLYDIFIHIFTDVCAFDVVIFCDDLLYLFLYRDDFIYSVCQGHLSRIRMDQDNRNPFSLRLESCLTNTRVRLCTLSNTATTKSAWANK